MAKWSELHNGKYPDPYSRLKLEEEVAKREREEREAKVYRVTALNVTRIWIEWAGRLAFGCTAEFSPSGLCFVPCRCNCPDVSNQKPIRFLFGPQIADMFLSFLLRLQKTGKFTVSFNRFWMLYYTWDETPCTY